MSAAPLPPSRPQPPVLETGRYVRYVGVLAIVLLVLIALNTLLSTPRGSTGPKPGRAMPPFAAPLAAGPLKGDADIATAANQGPHGRVPACHERGPQILNVCGLYERGPVALVMFVAASGCTHALDALQAALPRFPGLQAAGVAIRGDRAAAARLAGRLSFPIGYDHDGAVANLYGVVACPQVTLAYPGGVVAGRPLLQAPTESQLVARLGALYQESIARGWRPPPRR